MMNALKAQDSAEVLRLLSTYEYSEATLKGMLIPKVSKITEILKQEQKDKTRVQTTIAELYAMVKDLPEKMRHKYKLKEQAGDDIILYNNNPVISLNWIFYKRLLKRIDTEHFYNKLENIIGDYNLMSQVSSYMKQLGPKALIRWDAYVDITILFGWRKQPEGEPIAQKIKGWLSDKFKPNFMGSESMFHEKFREKIKKILHYKSGGMKINQTLDEFVLNIPQTGTNGGAFDENKKTCSVNWDGERTKFKHNKYAKSMYYSTEKKRRMVLEHKRGLANVSVKMEPYPKVRTIVSADFRTTLKMRFIDTWLLRWMKGNKTSTLFQTRKDTIRMWREMIRLTGKWAVPIDQSAFDAHVTKEMVMIMIQEIRTLISEFATGDETTKAHLVECLDSLSFCIDKTEIIYKYKEVQTDGGKTEEVYNFTYQNGVLSGWQWTAYFDTMINIAERDMAYDIMTMYTIEYKSLLFNAQGDDQLQVFETLQESLAYWAALASMGLEINLSKNFFSQEHNEYLRKYTLKNELNGYPARMINGMLWQYPGDEFPTEELVKLTASKDNWLKLSQRLKIQWVEMRQYWLSDIKGMRVNVQTAEMLEQMDPLYGGYGLKKPYISYSTSVIPGTIKGLFTIEGEGYEEFKKALGQGQERGLEKWCQSVLSIQKQNEQLRSTEKITMQKRQEIKPLEFTMIGGLHVNKPQPIAPYRQDNIFELNDELMQLAFPHAETFIEMGNAPKSWIYDYLVGRSKAATPQLHNMSDEMSALVWEEYEPSIVLAMLTKRTRTHDKWLRLQKYAQEKFQEVYEGDARTPKAYKMY